VIDEIVGESLNPATGIPYCAKIDGKWTNEGWWTPWIVSEGVKPGHSSYIVAQSLYYMLKAYELEEGRGREHAAWLAFVGKIIDTISKTQDENGAFPRFWDEATGAGSGYDAFSGCWVTAAIAYYVKLASRKDLLPAVVKSETRYYDDVVKMECSKTPLDVADAPDCEGILAFIRLEKILSELVGKTAGGEPYLDRMRTGIDYALSFTFCYNVPSLLPPLGPLYWSTSGGSITSVCNAVIHCMLNSIIDELQYITRGPGTSITEKGWRIYTIGGSRSSTGGIASSLSEKKAGRANTSARPNDTCWTCAFPTAQGRASGSPIIRGRRLPCSRGSAGRAGGIRLHCPGEGTTDRTRMGTDDTDEEGGGNYG
jgi:hypothetical protein